MGEPDPNGSSGEVGLLAGNNRSGAPVLEAVPAQPLQPSGRYLLTGSPLLALGTAAGDVLSVAADGSFEVLERGGNLAVQVFLDREEGSEPRLAALAQRVEALGGRLDGGADRGRVYTIPVVGLSNRLVLEFPPQPSGSAKMFLGSRSSSSSRALTPEPRFPLERTRSPTRGLVGRLG